MQLGPFPSSAGRGFLEQLRAAGVLERAYLGRGFLRVGFGDAGVAEEHVRRFFLLPIMYIWQQNYAKRKPLICGDGSNCCANDRLRNKESDDEKA